MLSANVFKNLPAEVRIAVRIRADFDDVSRISSHGEFASLTMGASK